MRVLIYIENYKKNKSCFPQDIKHFMFNEGGLSITKADQGKEYLYLELEDSEGE